MIFGSKVAMSKIISLIEENLIIFNVRVFL